MLTWEQEIDILLTAIIDSFKRQTGVQVQLSDFMYDFDVIDNRNKLAIMFNSNRPDDSLRIKAYVRREQFTSIGKFNLMELPNYGPGERDEVFVAEVTYDHDTLKALDSYFINLMLSVVEGLNLILSELDQPILNEHNKPLIVETA